MPTATILSRIGRFEFFAILAPGLCLVTVMVIFGAAYALGPDQSATAAITTLNQEASKQWPMSITMLFFAYMVGNILRAIPVSILDEICGRAFKWTVRGGDEYDRLAYQEDFPYVPLLKKQLTQLQENSVLEGVSLPVGLTAHTTFNLWKLTLCDRSPATFDYTQELEGRVRLFSGMIWAALISGVFGVLGAVFSRGTGIFHPSWFLVMTVVAAVSFIFVAVLGWRLRPVRAEEVRVVFLGILHLRLKLAYDLSQKEI
ncbi:MAG TPA: hypothetical protein VMP11_20475 [Verrucomicrobiae bacterium]|nr:hypothetical protein [Verrucomicrobiae bacterium]